MYTEFLNPIYAVWEGMPVIIIGARTESGVDVVGHSTLFVCIADDGTVHAGAPEDFVVDVRFKDGEWHDVSPGPQSDIE